ncbi:hypothetical protein LSPH24S_01201 [Lysinibacillus sphaericus]
MNKIKAYFSNLSLQRKWMLTSSAVIFISYAIICIVVYVSLHTWLLNDEISKVKRTRDDVASFLESQVQYIYPTNPAKYRIIKIDS